MDPGTVWLIACCSSLMLPIPGVHTSTTLQSPTTDSTETTSISDTTTPAPPSTTSTTPRSGSCDDSDSGVGRGIGIGIGIMLCIVAAVVGLLVFWLWRRGWTLPCNTDFAGKLVEEGDTSASVVPVKAKKTYGRQNPGFSQPAEDKAAASNPVHYSSYRAKEDNESYEALRRNLSQKSEVYEDPEKSQGTQRPPSQRPLSDMYEDPEKSTPRDRDSNYVEPMALGNRGSGKTERLSKRAPPDGKRQSQLDDDEPGEIYENTDDPPPPRKERGSNPNRPSSAKKDRKDAPGLPAADNDDLYIEMDGGGRADSIYMNTD